MPVVPTRDVDAIQYFENHLAIWEEHAAAIGASPAMVTSVTSVTKAARAAFTDQQEAKIAAKATTVTFRNAMRSMRTTGGDFIKTVKAFAANSANPSVVYATAQIDPPAPPVPQPPPGQPTDFRVELTSEGAVSIRWKSTNSTASQGVYFIVSRKLPGESTFTIVGNTASKTFVDDAIPAGTTNLTYVVQGFRGPNPGPVSTQLTLQFGMGGSGSGTTALKMAA